MLFRHLTMEVFTMNKKNISLILAGLLIQVLEFTINIGGTRIDIFSDIIAYALIIIGLKPLIVRSSLFKKCSKQAMLGLIISVITQALYFLELGTAEADLYTITKGLSTIISIYFTYYLSESIVLEAKRQDKSALTRNFRITWAILGIFIFAYYIAVVSGITLLSFAAQAVVLICAIYYSSTILNTCNSLYTEEVPKLDR